MTAYCTEFIFLWVMKCFIYSIRLHRKYQDKLFLWISCLTLALIQGLRADWVGTDTAGYIRVMQCMKYGIKVSGAPVYNFFVGTLYKTFENAHIINLILAFIMLFMLARTIGKLSNNVSESIWGYILLYFYFSGFNINRQYIAMLLSLMGMLAFKEKKLVIGIIWSLLAVGVHNTAIIGIGVGLLSLLDWNEIRMKRWLKISIILGGAAFILFDYCIKFFAIVFPRYRAYVLNWGNSVHSVYDRGMGRNILVTVFLLVIWLIFYWYRCKNARKYENDKMVDYYMIIAFLYLILGIIFANNLAISRLRAYFGIMYIFLLPYIFDMYRKSKWINVIIYGMLLVSCIAQLYLNIGGVVPYAFFWQ